VNENALVVTIIAVLAVGAAVMTVLWVHAIIRSRALSKQYAASRGAERLELEQQMADDPDLEHHMRPLPWWEIAFSLAVIAALLTYQWFHRQ